MGGNIQHLVGTFILDQLWLTASELHSGTHSLQERGRMYSLDHGLVPKWQRGPWSTSPQALRPQQPQG